MSLAQTRIRRAGPVAGGPLAARNVAKVARTNLDEFSLVSRLACLQMLAIDRVRSALSGKHGLGIGGDGVFEQCLEAGPGYLGGIDHFLTRGGVQGIGAGHIGDNRQPEHAKSKPGGEADFGNG